MKLHMSPRERRELADRSYLAWLGLLRAQRDMQRARQRERARRWPTELITEEVNRDTT